MEKSTSRRPRRTLTWLPFVCGLAALAAVSPSASGGALRGRVVNEHGAPVPGALIQLLSPAVKSAGLAAVANVNGDFSFTGLPAGQYQVFVSGEGHEPARAEGVEIARAGETGGSVVLRLAQPAAPPDASPPARWRLTPDVLVVDLPVTGSGAKLDGPAPVIIERGWPGWQTLSATDGRHQLTLLDGVPCRSVLDGRPFIDPPPRWGLSAVSVALPGGNGLPAATLGSAFDYVPAHGLRGRNGFLDIDLTSVLWQDEPFNRREFQWAENAFHREFSGDGGAAATRMVSGAAGGEFGFYDVIFSGLAESADTGVRGGRVNAGFRERLNGWLNVGYLATPDDELRFHLLLDSSTSLLSRPLALRNYQPQRSNIGQQFVLSKWQHRRTANELLDVSVLIARSQRETGAAAGSRVKRPSNYDLSPAFDKRPDNPFWEERDERGWTLAAGYRLTGPRWHDFRANLTGQSADVSRLTGLVGDPATFPGDARAGNPLNVALRCAGRRSLGAVSIEERLSLSRLLAVSLRANQDWADYCRGGAGSYGAMAEAVAAPWLSLFAGLGQRQQLPPLFAVADAPANSQSASWDFPQGNPRLQPERIGELRAGARIHGTGPVTGLVCWSQFRLSQLIVPYAADGDGAAATYANKGERAGHQAALSLDVRLGAGSGLQLAGTAGTVRGSAYARDLADPALTADVRAGTWEENGRYHVLDQPAAEGSVSWTWLPPDRPHWPGLFLRWRGRTSAWRASAGLDNGGRAEFRDGGHHETDAALCFSRAVLGQRRLEVTLMCANLFNAFTALRYDAAAGAPRPVPYDVDTYTPGRQVRIQIGVSI